MLSNVFPLTGALQGLSRVRFNENDAMLVRAQP